MRPPEAEAEPIDAVATEDIGTERAGVVYALCYANDRKLAQLEDRDVFEVKIGKRVMVSLTEANDEDRCSTPINQT